MEWKRCWLALVMVSALAAVTFGILAVSGLASWHCFFYSTCAWAAAVAGWSAADKSEQAAYCVKLSMDHYRRFLDSQDEVGRLKDVVSIQEGGLRAYRKRLADLNGRGTASQAATYYAHFSAPEARP